MSSPFGSAGVFAPNVGEKNARTAIIEFATNHAWLLDLTATRSRHHWRSENQEQDPNQFLRAAVDGGHWLIHFDYEVKGDPEAYRPTRQWDNTLRAATLWHSSWVNEKGVRLRTLELKNYHQANSSRSVLWDVTDPDSSDGRFKPLRKRVEDLLRNPELLVWLVSEKLETERVQRATRDAEYREQNQKRKQPLSVTIPVDEFKKLCWDLRSASYTLANADGLTDLAGEVARLQAMIAKIAASVKIPVDPE